MLYFGAALMVWINCGMAGRWTHRLLWEPGTDVVPEFFLQGPVLNTIFHLYGNLLKIDIDALEWILEGILGLLLPIFMNNIVWCHGRNEF